MWKDMLMIIFNLIDHNHSGFISRNEFADVMKLMLYNENNDHLHEKYVDELCSAMDFDGNGRIDLNEFLGKKDSSISFHFISSCLLSFL